MARPRIWLEETKLPTVLARIRALTQGESQPSPSRDLVPTRICSAPDSSRAPTVCTASGSSTLRQSVPGMSLPGSPASFGRMTRLPDSTPILASGTALRRVSKMLTTLTSPKRSRSASPARRSFLM